MKAWQCLRLTATATAAATAVALLHPLRASGQLSRSDTRPVHLLSGDLILAPPRLMVCHRPVVVVIVVVV